MEDERQLIEDYNKITLEKALGVLVLNSISFEWFLGSISQHQAVSVSVALLCVFSTIALWTAGSFEQKRCISEMNKRDKDVYLNAKKSILNEGYGEEEADKICEEMKRLFAKSAESFDKTSQNVNLLSMVLGLISITVVVVFAFLYST